MDDMLILSLDEVRDFGQRVLARLGLSQRQIGPVVETIVAGERDECGAHGIYRLLNCAQTISAGKVELNAEPTLHDMAPGLARVDGGRGYAQLAFEIGRPVLIEKARHCGIAALGLNNCVHFAALWPEVESLACEGLVAFAFTPNHAWVAPTGGIKPLFGTNPIAFGWPRPGEHPFVFDFATSAAARGDLELHRRADKPIPSGWAVDAEGQPTTNAAAAMAGAMLTFGGHKGSALAAMIELIAGPLIGDMTSVESLADDEGTLSSPRGGELIIAIDPARFLGNHAAEHLARAEQVFDGILSQGARLPSQRRYQARARSLAHGVKISRKLHSDIAAYLE